MARHSSEIYSSPDTTLINLTNLISRLEENLLSSSAYQQPLLASEYHRARVAANVEHGRTLLLQLERSLPNIKNQTRKHELYTDLTQKRQQIKSIKQCLDDLAVRAATRDGFADDEVSSDNGEDILHTPQGSASENSSPPSTARRRSSAPANEDEAGVGDGDNEVANREGEGGSPTEHPSAKATTTTAETSQHGTTTVRNRRPKASSTTQPHTQTPAPTATATATGSAFSPSTTDTNAKTRSTETSLTQSLTEQESLTSSLLSLATELKTSSQSFQTTLESEKSILSRAVEGLDRNISGMDAAGQRMGMLRRMSEGRGWWGRVLMYLWIFALWVAALLIVFLGPKLRF